MNLPLEMIHVDTTLDDLFGRLSDVALQISEAREIVTYCSGEDCHSSVDLAARLIEFGFENVKIFFGGWEEWNIAGLPVRITQSKASRHP